MAYTYLTMKELSWIESYFDTRLKAYKIAQNIGRSNQPVYKVATFLKEGETVIEYLDQYKQNQSNLPMKGQRKPNGHKETRGKQGDKRSLADRSNAYPTFENEFGHLEGDTIIGKDHKSAVITLAERVS